jgi:hypothetical protein
VPEEVQPQRGLCKDACFVSRNRFVVLTLSSRLTLKSFANEVKRTIDLPISTVTAVYSAGLGASVLVINLLLTSLYQAVSFSTVLIDSSYMTLKLGRHLMNSISKPAAK